MDSYASQTTESPGHWLLAGLICICASLWISCWDPSSAEWLAEAQLCNQEVDAAIARGRSDDAAQRLSEFFSSPVPDSINPGDARRVRQDMAFRLAQLALAEDDPQAALQWANRGLALGQAEDLFTANLLVVRGNAWETVGEDRRAASDYYRALRINDMLLRRNLGQEVLP